MSCCWNECDAFVSISTIHQCAQSDRNGSESAVKTTESAHPSSCPQSFDLLSSFRSCSGIGRGLQKSGYSGLMTSISEASIEMLNWSNFPRRLNLFFPGERATLSFEPCGRPIFLAWKATAACINGNHNRPKKRWYLEFQRLTIIDSSMSLIARFDWGCILRAIVAWVQVLPFQISLTTLGLTPKRFETSQLKFMREVRWNDFWDSRPLGLTGDDFNA